MKKPQSFLFASLAISASLGLASAAENLRYEDIPDRIVPFGITLGQRNLTVTTLDSKVYHASLLEFEPEQVGVFTKSWETIPREQVKRIELGQHRRFRDHAIDYYPGPWHPAVLIVPVTLAFFAVAYPICLAIDGLTFLLPP